MLIISHLILQFYVLSCDNKGFMILSSKAYLETLEAKY